MKRWRRALLVLLSTIAALLLAVVVGYFTLRVKVARYVIERQLLQAGFADTSFQIRQVTINRIELQSVELKGPQGGSAAIVQATYSLGSLLRGRVHSLLVQNARWTLELPKAEENAQAGAAASAVEIPRDLPLDQLSLRDVTILVPGADGAKPVAVNGSIRRTSADTFNVDMHVVGGEDFVHEFAGVEVAGLVVHAQLAIRTRGRETVVVPIGNNIIGVEQLNLRSGETSIHCDAVRLHLKHEGQQPLAHLTRGETKLNFRAAAEFESPSAMTLTSQTGHAFIPALSASLQVETTDSDLVTRMDVRVQDVSLQSEDFGGFAVSKLSGVIPIDFNVPVARRGPVSAEAIAWRGAQFGRFSGSVGMAEGFLDADVEGPLGGGARLAINAGFDFTDGVAGDIAAFIPPFQLTDAENIRRLVPQLREAHLAGTYTLNAQILLRNGAADPYVHVKATNAAIFNTRWPLAIDSADADVVFTSLAPLRTPPGQRLLIRQARVGKLEVDGGEIAFQVQDLAGTRIEDIRWSMGAYGQFRATPFSMNLLEPKFESTVTATDVELGAWLDLLTDGRATSNGVMDGTIEVRIDSSLRQPVRVLSGHLEGNPAQGNVAVEDARMLSQFLDRSAAHAVAEEQWELLRTRLVEALADYRYSLFQVDFLPQDDDVLCRIQTSGRGRAGPDAQEIALLTINVRNFNDVLNNVMLFRSALSGRE